MEDESPRTQGLSPGHYPTRRPDEEVSKLSRGSSRIGPIGSRSVTCRVGSWKKNEYHGSDQVISSEKRKPQKTRAFHRVTIRPAGRVRRCLNSRGSSRIGSGGLTGRVGSGRVRCFPNITGQVRKFRAGSGRLDPTRPDPRQVLWRPLYPVVAL